MPLNDNNEKKAYYFDLLHEICKNINITEDSRKVIFDVLEKISVITGWSIGHGFIVQSGFVSSDIWYYSKELKEDVNHIPNVNMNRYERITGKVLEKRCILWTHDFDKDLRKEHIMRLGMKTVIAFPVFSKENIDVVIEFFSDKIEDRDELFCIFLESCSLLLGRLLERRTLTGNIVRINNIFAAILKNSPIAVVVIDQDSKIVEWSECATQLFEWDRNEMIGKDLTETIIPVEYRLKHKSGMKRYLNTHVSNVIGKGPIFISALNKKGSVFPIKLSINKCVVPEHGLLFIGFIQDMTETQQIQGELQNMERTYKNINSLLLSIPYSIAVFDVDTLECIFRNKSFEKMIMGYDFHTFIKELSLNNNKEFLHIVNFIHPLTQRNYDLDIVQISLDEQLYFLLIIIDITEKLIDEKEKSELYIREKTAQEKSQLITDFLSNLSHEMRTPLHGIVGILEMLEETSLNEKQLEYVKMIQKSTDILQSTMNSILDVSNLQAGNIQSSFDCVNLKDIINNFESVYTWAANEKKLEFVLIDESETPLYFFTDKSKLNQILSNLIGNAIKFTEKGKIILRIEQAHNILMFHVHDTGIGIKQEAIDFLFKPFTQLASFSTKKYSGTGLGLYLAKNLAKLLDGDIYVDSNFGLGSTFTLQIPIYKCTDPKSDCDEDFSILKNVRILVAEDNFINRKVIMKLLTNANCIPIGVDNGKKAVEEFLKDPIFFKIILMDCQMPEMDGYQATREIRSLPEGQDIPIIAVTANAQIGEKERCLKVGMNDYISKPYKQSDLLHKIKIWLHTDECITASIMNEYLI